MTTSELEIQLISVREDLFKETQEVFKDVAIEGHVFGSIGRGDTDAYSDIDLWFTFKDEDFKTVYDNRFDYYARIGNVLNVCEAPQNAPVNGVFSSLLVQTGDCVTVIDIYLCPFSTSATIEEAKKLFGIDLPLGALKLNPQKVAVNENYRIDFFSRFIFGSIKNILRKEANPLEGLIREYNYLHKNYNIPVEPIENITPNLNGLEQVIKNTEKVANEKQKNVLIVIRDFARKVLN